METTVRRNSSKRRIKYEIAGEAFTSKKAVRLHGQKILRNTPVGEWVTGQDFSFLKELFERYREARNRESKAVVGIEVEPNTIGSGKGFKAYYEDGTAGDISYINAANSLNGYDPHPSQVKAAMREAVVPQIMSFRYEEISRGIDPDFAMNAEVDHLEPREFCELVEAFLKAEGITLHDIELEKIPNFRGSFLPEPLAERWRQFHGEHARLELVAIDEHKHRTALRRKARLAGRAQQHVYKGG